MAIQKNTFGRRLQESPACLTDTYTHTHLSMLKARILKDVYRLQVSRSINRKPEALHQESYTISWFLDSKEAFAKHRPETWKSTLNSLHWSIQYWPSSCGAFCHNQFSTSSKVAKLPTCHHLINCSHQYPPGVCTSSCPKVLWTTNQMAGWECKIFRGSSYPKKKKNIYIYIHVA